MRKLVSTMINRVQPHWAAHILLYHATYSSPPQGFDRGLHNVTPDEMEVQIRWLRRHYDVVSVDQLLTEGRPGRVAITFDDAYRSVFAEAVPRLLAMQVPLTIFISGASLQGRSFWRDKVRYIMSRDLTREFLDYLRGRPGEWRGFTPENFYAASKGAGIDMPTLDGYLGDFLAHAGIPTETLSLWVGDAEELIRDPLITYGNHGTNHYILAALTDEEQERDIHTTHTLLAGLDLPRSRFFSIPFGGPRHVNATTFRILKHLGYRGLLYAQGGCHRFNASGGETDLIAGQRLMAPGTLAELKICLARSFVDAF